MGRIQREIIKRILDAQFVSITRKSQKLAALCDLLIPSYVIGSFLNATIGFIIMYIVR